MDWWLSAQKTEWLHLDQLIDVGWVTCSETTEDDQDLPARVSRHVPSHRGRQQLNDVSLQKLIKNNDSAKPTWGFVWPGWGNCRGTALLRKQCPQLFSEQWCASLDFLVMPWNNTHTQYICITEQMTWGLKKNKKTKKNQKTNTGTGTLMLI